MTDEEKKYLEEVRKRMLERKRKAMTEGEVIIKDDGNTGVRNEKGAV